MNRNNETGTTKTRRSGTPHPDRNATVVKTLRAASLHAATTAPRVDATPLPVTGYWLPVTHYIFPKSSLNRILDTFLLPYSINKITVQTTNRRSFPNGFARPHDADEGFRADLPVCRLRTKVSKRICPSVGYGRRFPKGFARPHDADEGFRADLSVCRLRTKVSKRICPSVGYGRRFPNDFVRPTGFFEHFQKDLPVIPGFSYSAKYFN